MPEGKLSKALKLNLEDMEVKLIGREDNEADAEMRAARVQKIVAQIVCLGKKRGRPKHEDVTYEEAA